MLTKKEFQKIREFLKYNDPDYEPIKKTDYIMGCIISGIVGFLVGIIFATYLLNYY